MLFSIQERFALLNLLPAQGNYVTLKIVSKLRDEASFTEHEAGEVGLHIDGQQVTWDKERERDKEIEVGAIGKKIIVDELKKRDNEGTLTVREIGLYDKFMD